MADIRDHNEKKTFHASAKSFYLSSTELIKQEGVTFYWDTWSKNVQLDRQKILIVRGR